MNRKPPPTSANELGSCSKNRQWRELTRTTEGDLLMRQVIDFGQQKSTRKKIKKFSRIIMETDNKYKIELEVEKPEKTKPSKSPTMIEKISRFEHPEHPSNLADNHHGKKEEDKPKLNSEAEKNKQRRDKPLCPQSAARKVNNTSKKQERPLNTHSTRKNKHYAFSEAAKIKKKQQEEEKPFSASNAKKTSPIFGVKIEPVRRQPSKCDSPKLLTRMKPLKKGKSETLLKLVKPDARNSPVKKENFKLLLKSWEHTSNQTLTLAVAKTPRRTPKMDSQSQETLENQQKIGLGVSHTIGQQKLERGVSEETNQ